MSTFKTRLAVALVDDTANDGRGEWELTEPLIYQSATVGLVVVPKGFRTDYASVPRAPLAFLIAGDRAHRASVVHDYLIRLSLCDRSLADEVFLEAMTVTNIPEVVRDIMYRFVRGYTESLKPAGPEGRGHELF